MRLVRIRINVSRIPVVPPRAIPIRRPIPKRIPARPPAKPEAKAKTPATAPTPSPSPIPTPPAKAAAPTVIASAPISGTAEATNSRRRDSAAGRSERMPLTVGNGARNVSSASAPARPSAPRRTSTRGPASSPASNAAPRGPASSTAAVAAPRVTAAVSAAAIHRAHAPATVAVTPTMVAAAVAAAKPTTAAKAATTKTSASVETSAAASTAVTATLAERRCACAKNKERRESCQESLEQGGILHISSLDRRAAAAQAGKPSLLILLSGWTPIPSRKLPCQEPTLRDPLHPPAAKAAAPATSKFRRRLLQPLKSSGA